MRLAEEVVNEIGLAFCEDADEHAKAALEADRRAAKAEAYREAADRAREIGREALAICFEVSAAELESK